MTDQRPEEREAQPGPATGSQPGPPPGWLPSYAPPPPAHPQATTVLVLGLLALVVCQVIGPIAWIMGNRVVGEIDAARGAVGGRSEATIGRVLGIVATGLLAAGAAFFFLFVVFNVALYAGFAGFWSRR